MPNGYPDAGYVPGMAPPEPGTRIPGLPPTDDGFQTQKKKKQKPKPKPQEDEEAKADVAPKEEPPKPEPKKEVKKEEPKKETPKMEPAKSPKMEPKKETPKMEPAKSPKMAPKPEPKKEAPKAAAAAPAEDAEMTTDKLLRKAKKKLGEIEALIAKKAGQEMSPEEQQKVSKKAEFEAEIKYLQKVQSGKAVAPPPPKAKAAAKAVAKAEDKKEKAPVTEAPMALSPKTSADVEAAQKRLRNVQKKLREIEQLMEKKKGGTELSAEQEEKVSRKVEFEIELKHLSTIR